MDTKITVAGNYTLNSKHSLSKSIVYITGNAGGATLDLLGFGGILVDGAALKVGTQTEVRHGVDTPINLLVTGGAGIDLTVRCVGIH